MWWPLTLTYIFKVIWPWLWKSCPLCSVYSPGWILVILAQMIAIIRGCVACCVFFRICKFEFLANFWNFLVLTFPCLAQMITSMRGCVAYNEFWPWPISSRSFGLENHIRSVASTVLDGFFLYLIQMITSMRRCVACDDLWPWPISLWSFDLEFENRVRSITFSVLDRLFPYLPQIITTIRGCVACYVYKKNSKIPIFRKFSNFLAFTLKKNLQFCLHSFHIWHKSSLPSEGVSHVMTFDLDRYFQGHSALTLKIVSTL